MVLGLAPIPWARAPREARIPWPHYLSPLGRRASRGGREAIGIGIGIRIRIGIGIEIEIEIGIGIGIGIGIRLAQLWFQSETIYQSVFFMN